jgi:acetyl esterase
MSAPETRVVLEPAAQAMVEATGNPPFLFELPVAHARRALEDLQRSDVAVPLVEVDDRSVSADAAGEVSVRVLRPANRQDILPVILYIHGAGWVLGSKHTHDRLIRELCAGAGSVLVFPNYSLAPEARYPTAIEQNYAVLLWLARHRADLGIDVSRIAVAGDSVGANMAAAVTLMAKERSGPKLAGQVLFYPVTDANFDTASYRQFAEGYYLRRDAMQWFWDQYTLDEGDRAQITASPLRASVEQLRGLPPALVITGEADVLRDEGEAYADKLRQAGVSVTSVRYQGIIHDFVMLDALRGTCAAQAAIAQATGFLTRTLTPAGSSITLGAADA